MAKQLKYRISGIFHVGLIFAEFATSSKSLKIDTAKNKPYYTSSFRVFEIAKIELSENLTHLSSVIFAKISRCEQFPIYGIVISLHHQYHQVACQLKKFSSYEINVNAISGWLQFRGFDKND